MKLSNISTAPYRPEIKRLSQRDLQSPQFNSSSASSTRKWFHHKQGRVSPKPNDAWIHNDKSRKDSDNNQDKKKCTRRICFWIIIAIILLLIVGAIIGIVLGLTRPSSTNTESSTTLSSSISTTNSATSASTTIILTSMVCSNIGHGLLAFQNRSTPTTWTSYSYSFSASKTAPTLVFGFETDGTNSFYLDSVSVVDNNTPGQQLLNNPGFENSTTTPPTGWITSCEMTSCGSSATRIETSSICFSGNCFESFCSAGRSSLIFLSQTFSTINGNPHTVSYKLERTNIGSTGIMAFYLDII